MKVDGLANGLRRRRNYHYHLLDPMLMRLKVASCPPSPSAMAVLVAELPEINFKKVFKALIILIKGQIKPGADWHALDSPKKRTN